MSWKDGMKKLLPQRSATQKEIEALEKEISERKKKIMILKNNKKIDGLQKKNEKLGGR